jgi:hypothetical protein
MSLNPEFQRQLYLEYSPARLVGIPLVLGMAFTLSYLFDGHQLGPTTAKTALILFLIISLLWGGRQTGESITDEYSEHTWDTQRLSTLGAWEMAWGKWLGSTVMTWYGSAICLLVYALANNDPTTLPSLLIFGIITALLMQGGGLMMGLLSVQRGQTKNTGFYLLAVLAFFYITPWLMAIARYRNDLPNQTMTNWYGIDVDGLLFQQYSLWLALFWCGIGNYRLMMQSLGIRTLPIAWLGFNLFLPIYLGGMVSDLDHAFAMIAMLAYSTLTYVGISLENNDPMRLKRLLGYFKQGHWRRGAEETPIWWISLLLTLPFALTLSLTDDTFGWLGRLFHIYPLSIVLLVVRDCALYLYFYYGKPQRALTLSLLSAAMLYGVLPGIFTGLGLTDIAALFFPLWADSPSTALMFSLLQTSMVVWLMYWRWREKI